MRSPHPPAASASPAEWKKAATPPPAPKSRLILQPGKSKSFALSRPGSRGPSSTPTACAIRTWAPSSRASAARSLRPSCSATATSRTRTSRAIAFPASATLRRSRSCSSTARTSPPPAPVKPAWSAWPRLSATPSSPPPERACATCPWRPIAPSPESRPASSKPDLRLAPGRLRLPHRGNVGEVLRSARGKLVGDEGFSGNITSGNLAVDHDRQTVFVDGGEVYSRDTPNHFEADGRDAEAANGLAVGKVLYREFGERCAELGETFICSESVGRTGLDEDVHILGHARLGVEEDRISADDDIFNVIRVEGGQIGRAS